jgi:hypothetical protein
MRATRAPENCTSLLDNATDIASRQRSEVSIQYSLESALNTYNRVAKMDTGPYNCADRSIHAWRITATGQDRKFTRFHGGNMKRAVTVLLHLSWHDLSIYCL